jgi:hypothetical protein
MNKLLLILLFILPALSSYAQQKHLLSGRVTGEDSIIISGVSITNKTTGVITTSDTAGHYAIPAKTGDTIFFRTLGYLQSAYVMPAGKNAHNHIMVRQTIQLQAVRIAGSNYKRDSIRFHQEYLENFDFRRPRWYEVYGITTVNINQLYHALSIKKNKKKSRFKKQLINYEHDEFVSYKYSREIVNKLTNLNGDSLSLFMEQYHPTYDFMRDATDYDLYEFIKKSYNDYLSKNKPTARDTLAAGKEHL